MTHKKERRNVKSTSSVHGLNDDRKTLIGPKNGECSGPGEKTSPTERLHKRLEGSRVIKQNN